MKNSKKKTNRKIPRAIPLSALTGIPAHFHFLQFFQEGLTCRCNKRSHEVLKLQSIIKHDSGASSTEIYQPFKKIFLALEFYKLNNLYFFPSEEKYESEMTHFSV